MLLNINKNNNNHKNIKISNEIISNIKNKIKNKKEDDKYQRLKDAKDIFKSTSKSKNLQQKKYHYSEDKYDSDDSFIDDTEQPDNKSYLKQLKDINKKLQRGPIFDDDDDIEEDNFDQIQRLENNTLKIAEMEDYREEMKEMMRKKRKK